ncbi:Cof-type HAD-IIB family hydrolase [Candidatus Latescibacterota bacterium]
MKKAAGLLAVDVDGTLITDHGVITDEVYNALEKAHELNWEIIIASGRTFPAAKTIVGKLPFIKYAVMSNGACILDLRDFSVIHAETLSPEIVKEVIGIARNCGAIPALYDPGVIDQKIYYDTLEGACEYFEYYINTDPRCVRVDNVEQYAGNIMQISTVAEKDIIFSLRDALSGIDTTVMVLPYETPRLGGKSADYWFIQIVNSNAKKNLALRRIIELLNIPAGKYVAVGDNFNDCEMIEDADIGVAMGNAPDEVKKLADVVVKSNNHSGLAQVVEDILISGRYFP